MHIAANKDSVNTIPLLISHGADVNIRNVVSETSTGSVVYVVYGDVRVVWRVWGV